MTSLFGGTSSDEDPTITLNISPAINGIVKIKICNEFYVKYYFVFEFGYKFEKDNEWNTINFKTQNTLEEGKNSIFWIRLQVHLNLYELICRLRAKPDTEIYNDDGYAWCDWSEQYIVDIPSSLIDNPYKIGDSVIYRSDNEYYMDSKGIIIDKLDDGYLKIKDERLPNDKKEIVIHCARLSIKEIKWGYLIDIDEHYNDNNNDNNNAWICDQRLLLRNNDENVLKTYIALNEVYTEYSKKYILNRKDAVYFGDISIPHSFIGKFIAKNITHFLCSYEYLWKIQCVLHDEHGFVDLQSLREYMMDTNIRGCRNGMDMGYHVDGRQQWCDICHVMINQFQYMFHCNVDMAHMNDYCIKCINTMITKQSELQTLLKQLLLHSINIDCIQVIVTCVAGKIIQIPIK